MSLININLSATLEVALEEAEREVIKQALKLNKYNQSKTAASLGLSRGGLRIKLKKYFPGEYTSSRS